MSSTGERGTSLTAVRSLLLQSEENEVWEQKQCNKSLEGPAKSSSLASIRENTVETPRAVRQRPERLEGS
jgi:hypothetical protein